MSSHLGCNGGGSCPAALGVSDGLLVNGIYGVDPANGETLNASGSLFDCGGDEFAVADGKYYVVAYTTAGHDVVHACDIDQGQRSVRGLR